MQTYTARCVLDNQAALGEGPSWDQHEQKLLWVDIENHLVNRFDPITGDNESWTVEQHPSFAIATQQRDIVIGTRHGIVRLDPATGEITKLVDPEPEMETNRFNDGKCDPEGRLFAGTISDSRTEGDASCYCIEPDLSFTKVVPSATNSNGQCWSSDQKTYYYIDSATRRVDAFDYDAKSGKLTNRRPVIQVPEDLGKPDGMTIDAEGMLWTGMFRGSAICRWNPQTKELIGKVDIPCPNVTSCCFGGQDLDQLFITTARIAMSDEQLKTHPTAGGLFVCQPGVSGTPTIPFAD